LKWKWGWWGCRNFKKITNILDLIAITTRREIKDDEKQYLKKVVDYLIKMWKTVLLSQHARIHIWGHYSELWSVDYENKFDLLIVFWWDWSVLRAVRNLTHYDTKLLAVDMWTLWFLASVSPEDAVKRLWEIFAWKYKVDERELLEVAVFREKKEITRAKVLNDIVISYKDIARLISVKATIDNKTLTKYRADWLIISTPTGSTAYNLSAWWPILYPLIPAIIITPICPHSFTQKSIAIPNTKKLRFEIDKSNDEKASITFDGQIVHTLEIWDVVKVRKFKKTLHFIRFPWEHFYKVIRKKLNWWVNLV